MLIVGIWLDFANWADRGMTIRSGPDVRMCLLNLAKALEEVQVVSSAEYNGAAGAIALLPTAGAMLGSPTREMWIVYKLVPIAGILMMFLSMGATITPSDLGEYVSEKAFSFSKRTPMSKSNAHHDDHGNWKSDVESSEPTRFAREVQTRSRYTDNDDVTWKIWVAIFCQLVFIGVIIIAMWFAQRGAVIPWWCRVWGWMFFWYFIVIISSVCDNIVAAPFTHSWTLRVAAAPFHTLIDDETQARVTQYDREKFTTVMDALKVGINLTHPITIQQDDEAAYSRTCFYVVISVQGISAWHAILQLVSRLSSIIIFAFGTALFASATLMSISAALMLLALVLPMAFAGRAVALWIAAEMNKHNKSILHAVVQSKKDASEYMEEVLDLPGLQIETMGHVILDGVCVTRRSRLVNAATYIGLLAKPHNLGKKAGKRQRQDSIPMLQMHKATAGRLRAESGVTQRSARSGSN